MRHPAASNSISGHVDVRRLEVTLCAATVDDIEDETKVAVLAVRHLLEDDYH